MLKKDSVLVVDVEWLLVLDLDSLLLSESGQVCVCVCVGRRSDIGAWFRLVAPPGPMAFVKTFVQVRMLS